jgi:hypothetical protein
MKSRKQLRNMLRIDASEIAEACAGWNSRLAAWRITQFFDRGMASLAMIVPQLGLMAQIGAADDETFGHPGHAHRPRPVNPVA